MWIDVAEELEHLIKWDDTTHVNISLTSKVVNVFSDTQKSYKIYKIISIHHFWLILFTRKSWDYVLPIKTFM
jgi:hypothetical protein